MELEAGAFEPLHLVLLTVRQRLGLQTGHWQAEQCQTLGGADGFFVVQHEAVGLPHLQNITANGMTGLAKDLTAAGVTVFGKGEPIATLLVEAVGAEAPEEHIVGAGICGVEL